MRIKTLWKMWDDDAVELLYALDEGTLLVNPDYWAVGYAAALERYRIAAEDVREVWVTVPLANIQAAFDSPEVTGAVGLTAPPPLGLPWAGA